MNGEVDLVGALFGGAPEAEQLGLFAAIMTGLVAGLLHVVSGPDHLAAVLPMAVDAPRRSVRLGVLWGIGHGLGVIGLGGLFFAFRSVTDIAWISFSSELIVGVLLVALGVWALRRSRLVVVHHHAHEHPPPPSDKPGPTPHAHPHVHFNDPTVDRPQHVEKGQHRFHHHSTLGFGFIHGLAGAGHLVVAMPMLALSAALGVVYLVSYLAGGMAAMMGFAYCAGALVRKPAWIPTALRMAGLGSMVVGLFWISSFARVVVTQSS